MKLMSVQGSRTREAYSGRIRLFSQSPDHSAPPAPLTAKTWLPIVASLLLLHLHLSLLRLLFLFLPSPTSPALSSSGMGLSYVELSHTLADAFNALANEVQTLTDRKTVLEHKLRFAHEQVRIHGHLSSLPTPRHRLPHDEIY